MKKILSFFLAAVMVITTMSSLTTLTFAASADDLSFTLNDDGESYCVSDCNSSASGALIIPATYNGKPVTSIGTYAFSGCDSLTSVTIPDSVTSIENNSFSGCDSLISVIIPDSVTGIGEFAFANCSSLASVSIPNSVTSIGYGAFRDCTGLTSITISDSVTSIGTDAFKNTEYYDDYNNWSDGALYIGKHLIAAKTTLSGKYEIKPGTICIADSVFYSFQQTSALTSVTIPNSVKSIGIDAFGYCVNLTSITIPNSVTSIGDYAFINCTRLASVKIPNSVTTIGTQAFLDCSKLSSITISDSVTSLGREVVNATAYFADDKNWSDGVLYVSKYVTNTKNNLSGTYNIKPGTLCIADYAFAEKSNLTSVTIPDSVTNIGNSTFYKCSSLASITLPISVKGIGERAFESCWRLKTVNIGYATADIKSRAFYNCERLTSVTIPSSVKSIGNKAFGYCGTESLDSVQKIDGFAITGVKGSTAESYATANGFTFTGMPEHVHTYGAWKVDKAATCTADGVRSKACSGCGYKETEAIIKLGHNFSKEWTIDKAATTSAAGSKSHHCTRCNAKTDVTAIPKLPSATLAAPKLSSVKNTSTGVTVTWGKVSGATGYRVYRKASSEKSWTKIATITKNTTVSYTDKTAKSGTTYAYTVRGYNSAGAGAYNKTGLSIKYLAQPKVTAANYAKAVTVKWGKITGATGYIVYRKAGSAKSWTKLATITKNGTTSYTDKNVKSGTNYKYTVKAYYGKTYSSYTSGTSIKFLSPTTLKSAVSGKTGITLKFNKVTAGTGYIIYRKTGNGSYSRLATVSGNTKTTYVDKTAKKGKTYTYTVKVSNGKYYSANSNTKTCKDKY